MDLAAKTARQISKIQKSISTIEAIRSEGGLFAKIADYRSGREELYKAKAFLKHAQQSFQQNQFYVASQLLLHARISLLRQTEKFNRFFPSSKTLSRLENVSKGSMILSGSALVVSVGVMVGAKALLFAGGVKGLASLGVLGSAQVAGATFCGGASIYQALSIAQRWVNGKILGDKNPWERALHTQQMKQDQLTGGFAALNGLMLPVAGVLGMEQAAAKAGFSKLFTELKYASAIQATTAAIETRIKGGSFQQSMAAASFGAFIPFFFRGMEKTISLPGDFKSYLIKRAVGRLENQLGISPDSDLHRFFLDQALKYGIPRRNFHNLANQLGSEEGKTLQQIANEVVQKNPQTSYDKILLSLFRRWGIEKPNIQSLQITLKLLQNNQAQANINPFNGLLEGFSPSTPPMVVITKPAYLRGENRPLQKPEFGPPAPWKIPSTPVAPPKNFIFTPEHSFPNRSATTAEGPIVSYSAISSMGNGKPSPPSGETARFSGENEMAKIKVPTETPRDLVISVRRPTEIAIAIKKAFQAIQENSHALPVIRYVGSVAINDWTIISFIKNEFDSHPAKSRFTLETPLTIIQTRKTTSGEVTTQKKYYWDSNGELITRAVPHTPAQDNQIDVSNPNRFLATAENKTDLKNMVGISFLAFTGNSKLQNITITFLGNSWLLEETMEIKNWLDKQARIYHQKTPPRTLPFVTLEMPYVDNLQFSNTGQRIVFNSDGGEEFNIETLSITSNPNPPTIISPPACSTSRRPPLLDDFSKKTSKPVHPTLENPFSASSADPIQPVVPEVSLAQPNDPSHFSVVNSSSQLLPRALTLSIASGGKGFSILYSGQTDFLKNPEDSTITDLGEALKLELLGQQRFNLVVTHDQKTFEFFKTGNEWHQSERSWSAPHLTELFSGDWVTLFEHLLSFLKPISNGSPVRNPTLTFIENLDHWDTNQFIRLLTDLISDHPISEGQIITFNLEATHEKIQITRRDDQIKATVKKPDLSAQNYLILRNPIRNRYSLIDNLAIETFTYRNPQDYQKEMEELLGKSKSFSQFIQQGSPAQWVLLHRFIHLAYTLLDLETVEAYQQAFSPPLEEKLRLVLRDFHKKHINSKILLPLEKLDTALPGRAYIPQAIGLRDTFLRKIFADSPQRPPQANFELLRDPDRLAKLFIATFNDHMGNLPNLIRMLERTRQLNYPKKSVHELINPAIRSQLQPKFSEVLNNIINILKDIPEYRRILMGQKKGEFHDKFLEAIFFSASADFVEIYQKTRLVTLRLLHLLKNELKLDSLPPLDEIIPSLQP